MLSLHGSNPVTLIHTGLPACSAGAAAASPSGSRRRRREKTHTWGRNRRRGRARVAGSPRVGRTDDDRLWSFARRRRHPGEEPQRGLEPPSYLMATKKKKTTTGRMRQLALS